MTDQHRATPEQDRADPQEWKNVVVQCIRGNSAAATILELRARVEALEAAQNAPTTTKAQPRGLVERVANAISEGDEPDKWHPEARTAIREVAKWLRAGRMLHAAELLEQETDRG